MANEDIKSLIGRMKQGSAAIRAAQAAKAVAEAKEREAKAKAEAKSRAEQQKRQEGRMHKAEMLQRMAVEQEQEAAMEFIANNPVLPEHYIAGEVTGGIDLTTGEMITRHKEVMPGDRIPIRPKAPSRYTSGHWETQSKEAKEAYAKRFGGHVPESHQLQRSLAPRLSVRIDFNRSAYNKLMDWLDNIDLRSQAARPIRIAIKRIQQVLEESVKKRYIFLSATGKSNTFPAIKPVTIRIKRYRKNLGYCVAKPEWILRETNTTLNSISSEVARKGIIVGFIKDKKRPERPPIKDGSPGRRSRLDTTLKLADHLSKRWRIFPVKVAKRTQHFAINAMENALVDWLREAVPGMKDKD